MTIEKQKAAGYGQRLHEEQLRRSEDLMKKLTIGIRRMGISADIAGSRRRKDRVVGSGEGATEQRQC